MPPKKVEEAPKKPKKPPPRELCGCGIDTYRPPPKTKKLMKLNNSPLLHNPGCRFQRTTCDAYPHLPPCEVCLSPCRFCKGKFRWCPHCYETPCKYRFQRVVIGIEPPRPLVERPPTPPPPVSANAKNKPPAKGTTGKAPAAAAGAPSSLAGGPGLPLATQASIRWPPYRPTGLRPTTLVYFIPKVPNPPKKKGEGRRAMSSAAANGGGNTSTMGKDAASSAGA